MSWPELEVGTYQATEKFRAVESHACVCTEEDGGLVAVTGPAGDAKAERYARLFAAAPALLEALERAERWVSVLSEDSRLAPLGVSPFDVLKQARAAIAKARRGPSAP